MPKDYSEYNVQEPCYCIKDLILELSRFNLRGSIIEDITCRKHGIMLNVSDDKILSWPACSLCGETVEYEHNAFGDVIDGPRTIEEITHPSHDAKIYEVYEPCACIKAIEKANRRKMRDYNIACYEHNIEILRDEGVTLIYLKCPVCKNDIELEWSLLKKV